MFQQVKVPGRHGNRTVIQHEDAYINTPITFREPSANNCFQNHFSRVHLARLPGTSKPESSQFGNPTIDGS